MKFKKISKAEPYNWTGIGVDPSSVAASYAAIDSRGKTVAIISRVSGGGYMEEAHWRANATEPMRSMFGKMADDMIVGSGRTLEEVKRQLITRYD